MRNAPVFNPHFFGELFTRFLSVPFISQLFKELGPGKRRACKLSPHQLIMGMVFHVLSGAGTLAQHVNQLTGIDISDSALSQRRGNLDWGIFEGIMATALKPRAHAKKHPTAFYEGLVLCGVDGSQFSVANTPQVKQEMKKAKSRRKSAAFAKVGLGVLVELGIHNPIAAAIGIQGESEMVFAQKVLLHLPEDSLLIGDRYYGVAKVIVLIQELHPEGNRQFLLRVRSNLKGRVLEAYADGSALIEVETEGRKVIVREVQARVRVGNGAWSTVRLWTSLLDWRKHRAETLVALYARRWEQEGFYRELKVDMRSANLVQSHTPETAAQEIAALLVAYSILVEQRLKVASLGEVEVVRISFLKVMQTVSGLWQFLELTEGMLTSRQVSKVVTKALQQIAKYALGKRRKRSCPRALRQPVSSWPRLIKNTYKNGESEYELLPIKTRLP
jgi:Transposase DDE domain